MGVVVPVDRVLVGVRAGTAIHPELAGVLQPGASVEVGLGGRPNRALRVRQGVIAGLSALEADVILAPGVWASIGAFDRKGSRGFAMDLRAVVAPSTSLLSGGLLGWTTRIVLDLGTEL